MTTAATGVARKTKVSPQGSVCKPDQFGRLFAAETRWRHEELFRWREYLLIERRGKTARLDNLALAAWRLVTSHGLLPVDAKGRALAILREDGSYLIGVSQLADLAGCSTQTIYRELREFVDQIGPMEAENPYRPIAIWSCDPDGFRNGIQSEWIFEPLLAPPAEVTNALVGPSHFEKVASHSGEVEGGDLLKMNPTLPPEGREGKGTVCSSGKINNPSLPSLPPKEGAKAPRGGVGGGGEILSPEREALKAAIIEVIGSGPQQIKAAQAAARQCSEKWVEGFTDRDVLLALRAKAKAEGGCLDEDLAMASRVRDNRNTGLIKSVRDKREQRQSQEATREPAAAKVRPVTAILEQPAQRESLLMLKVALTHWIAAQATAYEVANTARLERRSTTPEEKLLVQEASRANVLVDEAMRKTGPIEVPGGVARHDDKTQWRALLTVLEGMDLSQLQECPVAAPQSPEALVSTATGGWVAANLLDALEAHLKPGAEDDAEVLSKWLAEAGPLALDGCLVQIEDEASLRALEQRLRKLLAERETA